MHKCFKCGTEFEGNFCPECGTEWQEQKYCPQCWAVLAGSAKFCNNCGYSFVEETEKKKTKKPRGENKFFKWLKKHLKAVIATSCVLVVLIVMLSLIPTFSAMSVNGTYFYTMSDGELSENNFITLSTGKWKNSNGVEGKYSYSLGKITMKYEDKAMKELAELLGQDAETTVELSGTIKNGVLMVTDGKREQIYVSKNHKHKFGEWETVDEPTCTTEGEQRHICACKKYEKKAIATISHDYGWQTTIEPTCTEEGEKQYMCSMCQDTGGSERTQTIPAIGRHDIKKGICTRCDFTQLQYELNEGGTGYTVTGFNDEVEERVDAVILSEYNGKTVTRIGDYAFDNCKGLASVTIPGGITNIGYKAFYDCEKIKNIYFMGDIADWCAISGLGNLMCGEERRNGFDEDDPDDPGLPYVNVFATAPFTDKKLFINNKEITGELVIPDGVTSIGNYAFWYCDGLTSVAIGNGVTSIGSSAFLGCRSLTSITFPNGVTSIGNYAFLGCSSLTSITLPNGVTSIGGGAFRNCTGLTSITVPDSVTSIGEGAFLECSGLASITYKGTKAQWKAITKDNYWDYDTGNFTVQCTDGKLDKNGNEIA